MVERATHHAFGTVCDVQTRGEESFGLGALMAACIAQAALDYDEGLLPRPARQREIEENLWRAIRHGMDAMMMKLDRFRDPRQAQVERLTVDGAGSRVPGAGCRVAGAERCAAGSSRAGGRRLDYRVCSETRRTYAPERITR